MFLLENLARLATPEEHDIYGSGAIACLMLGRETAEANARIRRVAEWFEHPHPYNRDPMGENDFAAIKLCRALHMFAESPLLEDDAAENP